MKKSESEDLTSTKSSSRRPFFLRRWIDKGKELYYDQFRKRMIAHEDRFRHITTRFSTPAYRLRIAFLRGFHLFRVKVTSLFASLSPFLFPVFGVLLICGALWFVSRYTLGLSVVVDDNVIGYVSDSSVYQKINNAVETAVKNESLEQTGQELYLVEQFPVLRFAVVEKDTFTSEEELYQSLYTMASEYTRQSYGLFVDGTLVATSKDSAVLDLVLHDILQYYAMYGEDDNLEIMNYLEVVRGEYPSSYEMGYSRIMSLFRYGSTVEYYTVEKGDTPASVSERFGLSLPVFRLMNGLSAGSRLSEGQTVRVEMPRFRLSVKNTQRITETEVVPYETEYRYSADLYEGTRETVRSGSNGLREVVSDVVYIDGEATSVTPVSSTQIKDPVTRIVVVGTKTIAPSGRFIVPLKSYQFVSSRFGWRWLRGVRNFHRGLDIAAQAGTPIYAADGGTVSQAGWDKSLGYYVRINHGNGIETIYGHCSSIASGIYVGKKVYQGERIAFVGKTGNATGNHLHFAVYRTSTGEYMDPSNYIKI